MNDVQEQEKRTLSIKRTFQAPRSLVWQAWTQAEHIAQWWGPPGMQVQVHQHDFREGGTWKYSMTMPNGQDFISQGMYSKIVSPKRIETSADFKPMTEGVILVAIFREAGNQTEFELQIVHPTEAYRKQQEEMGSDKGWGSVFDRLAQHLASLN